MKKKRKSGKSEHGSRTPYDDAFRILSTMGGNLLIPLINEMFGKESPIPMDAEIESGANEQFPKGSRQRYHKRITDGIFKINDETFHIECQSTNDGEILIRIVEYDFTEGLKSVSYTDGTLEIRMPHSGLLFLRKTDKTPDELHVIIKTDGTDGEYDVNVLNLRDYSFEELKEKNLQFLMPFYMFNMEKELADYSDSETSRADIRAAIDEILMFMQEQYESGKISYMQYSLLTDMFRQVTENLASADVREEVNDFMNGRIVFRGESFYRDGLKDGLAEGRASGLAEGRSEGEGRFASLVDSLIAAGRMDDVKKASADEVYRQKLYREFDL